MRHPHRPKRSPAGGPEAPNRSYGLQSQLIDPLGWRVKRSFLGAFRTRAVVFPPDAEELIRSELFSLERLEQHAASLAAAQRVTASPGACRHLATRLKNNSRVLLAAYRDIEKAVREDRAVTPAAEWLLDNSHVAQEQIRQVRQDVPRGYSRGLPRLAEGPLEYGEAFPEHIAAFDPTFAKALVRWLTVAASVPGFIGFAVGRTTFWDAVADFVGKRATRSQAVFRVAQRYHEWAAIFAREDGP